MNNPYPLEPTLATIPDDKIPGRESEITQLLRLLRTQSVSVEEMRRMGKTLLLKKLTYLSNNNLLPEEFKENNFRARYLSFQGKQNLGEVIDMIMGELSAFKEWYQIDFSKTYGFIKEVFAIPGVEVAGVKVNLKLPEYKKSWKEIFFKALEDIADVQDKAGATLVLIFDELPIMLWEWYKEGKQEDALELLDILRERRQALEKKGIRFVYCGSIGIKVVLNTFRTEFKYTGEPTNEMEEFDLKPFSKEESDFLCECFLLSKFKIDAAKKEECFALVFQLSNGLPFHISKMFNIVQTEMDYDVSPPHIQQAYDLILNEAKHHGSFKQLIDRLGIYYPKEKAEQMKILLDQMSREEDFIFEEDLYAKVDIDSLDVVKQTLYTLLGDHYLVRKVVDGKRAFKFKYQIFKEWWKINIA